LVVPSVVVVVVVAVVGASPTTTAAAAAAAAQADSNNKDNNSNKRGMQPLFRACNFIFFFLVLVLVAVTRLARDDGRPIAKWTSELCSIRRERTHCARRRKGKEASVSLVVVGEKNFLFDSRRRFDSSPPQTHNKTAN